MRRRKFVAGTSKPFVSIFVTLRKVEMAKTRSSDHTNYVFVSKSGHFNITGLKRYVTWKKIFSGTIAICFISLLLKYIGTCMKASLFIFEIIAYK